MKSHQQLAKEAIGFPPRPMSESTWQRMIKREQNRKNKKNKTR